MTDNNQYKELELLIIRSLDGTITSDEFSRLNDILRSDVQARKTYRSFMTMYCDLEISLGMSEELNSSVASDTNQDISQDCLVSLAEYENNAPAIEIEPVEDNSGIVEEVQIVKDRKQNSRFYRIFDKFVYIAAAFMIIFIIYAEVFSPQYTVPVASVIDQINVKWGNGSHNLNNNDRILTNQPHYEIEKGIIKISYDSGVDVIIEGPARFQFEKQGIDIKYGRLYSYVSNTGRGFTVDTPNSRFIDLGTEFGVFVDKNETSELHVLKGEVQYYSGRPGTDKVSRTIKENNARRFNADTGEVQAIPVAEEYFARQVNSKSGMIWRGQKSLDLTSIIAGLDGFTPVKSAKGISPLSGTYESPYFYKDTVTNNKYNLFNDSLFIDGVFVPDGGKNLVTVSSTGITFNCPNTSGKYSHNICVFRGGLGKTDSTILPPVFNNQDYSLLDEPVLFMHSNCGLTIDLQAIKDSKPELNLDGFTAWGGITEAAKDVEDEPDVNFWILVDGQIRYKKEFLKIDDGTVAFDIDISSQDRFLTIIVSDALKDPDRRDYPWGNDFFYLVSPQIELTHIIDN